MEIAEWRRRLAEMNRKAMTPSWEDYPEEEEVSE
jgi:hypothetical protein